MASLESLIERANWPGGPTMRVSPGLIPLLMASTCVGVNKMLFFLGALNGYGPRLRRTTDSTVKVGFSDSSKVTRNGGIGSGLAELTSWRGKLFLKWSNDKNVSLKLIELIWNSTVAYRNVPLSELHSANFIVDWPVGPLPTYTKVLHDLQV